MIYRIFWLIIVCLFLSLGRVEAQTPLATAVANATPGVWTLFATNGLTPALLAQPNGYHLFNFAQTMMYDYATQTIYFVGRGHDPANLDQDGKFIKYDLATNTWSQLPELNQGGVGHEYNHLAIDTRRGHIYMRNLDSTRVSRYDIGTGIWTSSWSNVPALDQVSGSVAYFEERDELLWFNGDWGLWSYNLTSGGPWTQLAFGFGGGSGFSLSCGSFMQNGYSQFMHVSKKHRMVWLGGGTSPTGTPPSPAACTFRYDAYGAFVRMPDAPIPLTNDGSSSQITVDPVTGLFHVFGSNSWRTFNASTQTWAVIDATGASVPWFNIPGQDTPNTQGVILTPLHDLGAIMIAKWSSSAPRVYIYKSSAITAQTSDFQARCNGRGVVRCFGFDTTVDFDTGIGGVNGAYGRNWGIIPPSGTSDYTRAVQDASTFASGGGSIRFTIPSNSPSDMAGSWHTNFSGNLNQKFTSGQTFYIQWRQRFSSCYLFQGSGEPCSGAPRAYVGGGGWKQSIIGSGDNSGCSTSVTTNCRSSCTAQEVVSQNTEQRGVPQMYHNCGTFVPFAEPFGGGNFRMQNGYTPGICPYSEWTVGNLTNCFPYYANEWMTFMVRITLGTWDGNSYPNSTVQQWVARDGQAFNLIQSYIAGVNPKDLLNPSSGESDKYGKVWLLPYNTGKQSSETHPTAFTWYDEVIISTSSINAPGQAGGGGSGPPSAPTGFKVTNP